MTNGAGELRVCSVAPEPARRLDAVQFGKIKGADRLQLVCERRLQEIVGQVVEPPLILILKVEQGAYRILPALRSGARGGPAVVGNAAAVAVPGGVLDNAVVAVRWSKP